MTRYRLINTDYVNSDFSYPASKCFNLTSKNRSKSCKCPSVSLSVQYLMQIHNWINFKHFFRFFCKFLTRHIQKWQHITLFRPPQLKNLKFVMFRPQLLRSISNCVTMYYSWKIVKKPFACMVISNLCGQVLKSIKVRGHIYPILLGRKIPHTGDKASLDRCG